MMEVRGRALKSIQKFVQKEFGQEGFDRWLSAVSVDAYTVYSLPIDAGEWFPLKKLLIDPTANIAQLFYKWDLKKASWEMGRYSADFGLKGPFRLFFKVGSTKYLFHKASEFLPMFYKPSTIEVAEYRDGLINLHITRFPEIDKTTEYRIGGWAERVMEINGCKNVNVEITKSLTTFDAYTEFQITWDAT